MSLLRVKLHNPWQLLHPKERGLKSYCTLKPFPPPGAICAQVSPPLGAVGETQCPVCEDSESWAGQGYMELGHGPAAAWHGHHPPSGLPGSGDTRNAAPV